MTVISAQWRSKHAIPKKWALNNYITQCIGNSTSLEIRELENDAVEKTAPGRRGPRDPRLRVWGSDELEIRCGRENLRLGSPGERERNADGHKSGGHYVAFLFKSHREQGLDYREGKELSWCPSWSNSLWQGWSCWLVYCPVGNATDSIWRVLASSDGISSWTPLKPQHSNPNSSPNPLVNQLWCIDFLTPPTPLIIPHRLLESLMPLKNWCSICCILTFDPVKHAIPKWCTGRKWHIPMASNRKKSRRQVWLTKWDKVKAHDTLIDWCTRREWPLNCMSVISAWWQSNMPFQRLSGRLNYYITRWGQEVRRVGEQANWRSASWRSDELETRCGRETPPPSRRGPRDPRLSLGTRPVGDKML